MGLISLQTQRQLEDFLVQAGIRQPKVSVSMHFSFPGNELFIEQCHHQLWITVKIDTVLDDTQLLTLFNKALPGLTTRYLLRPFRIVEGTVLNVAIGEETTSEELTALYRYMLYLLAPWRKRSYS